MPKITFNKSGNSTYDFPFTYQSKLIDTPLNFEDGTTIEFEYEADVRSFFETALVFHKMVNGYLLETYNTPGTIRKLIELSHLQNANVKYSIQH